MSRLLIGALCLFSASLKAGPVAATISYVVVKTALSIVVDKQLPTHLFTQPETVMHHILGGVATTPAIGTPDTTQSGMIATAVALTLLSSQLP